MLEQGQRDFKLLNFLHDKTFPILTFLALASRNVYNLTELCIYPLWLFNWCLTKVMIINYKGFKTCHIRSHAIKEEKKKLSMKSEHNLLMKVTNTTTERIFF